MNKLVLAALVALAACKAGPDYVRPAAPGQAAPAFKEAALFRPALPADALDRGPWWELFQDPELNALAAQVERANQDVLAAEANYRAATALVREVRSSLFPVITAATSYTRSGIGASSNQAGGTALGGSGDRFQLNAGASWTPDLFGRVRRSIESARASQGASAADLANLRLALQGQLVVNYLQLRSLDEEERVLRATVAANRRDVEITNNRYRAGVAAKVDLVQAQAQLLNAETQLADIPRQRGVLEHAIAVLTGRPPVELTIPVQPGWRPVNPAVPPGIPSALLERRPDVAAAERRVAAANAQIGIETAAFFPDLTLTGSVGQTANSIGNLFNSAANVWSLGAQLFQTVFDAGARRARVAQSRAQWEATVADYRSTVLFAFQDVEDQLLGVRTLSQQYDLSRQSAARATEAENLIRNQYKAGQVAYSDVIVAQTQALSARRTAVQSGAAAQVAAANLILALGGGWDAARADPPVGTVASGAAARR